MTFRGPAAFALVLAGVRLVWVIEQATVAVHCPGGPHVLLGLDDTLSGDDVLPGFAPPIAKLLAE